MFIFFFNPFRLQETSGFFYFLFLDGVGVGSPYGDLVEKVFSLQ